MRFKRVLKQTRKLLITTGMALLLFSAIAQPTMTAYAAEAHNNVAVTQTQAQQIVSYSQAQVKALGGWEQQADGVTWKFKQFTGQYLTSSWLESQTTAGVWYYIDASGVMARSSVTPDGYTVDANGEWRAEASQQAGGTEQAQTGKQEQQAQNNNSGSRSTVRWVQPGETKPGVYYVPKLNS